MSLALRVWKTRLNKLMDYPGSWPQGKCKRPLYMYRALPTIKEGEDRGSVRRKKNSLRPPLCAVRVEVFPVE